MIVPAKMVGETLGIAGEDGALLRRRQQDVFDNTFVENLRKNGL